ncbi:MAG TPA: FHA domain-containing protein [Planctomycetes bacterium]|nr:FHA domain-containing protein [Planctomycetota bacterium]
MSSKILVRDGGRQTIVEIGDDPITIGRDPSSRIVIEDRLASRNHGRFYWEESCYIYEDLGSSNGSMHGGKKVERIALGDGDSIKIGEVELLVEMSGVIATDDVTPVVVEIDDTGVSQESVLTSEPVGRRLRMEVEGNIQWISVFPDLVIGRSPEVDVTIDDSRISSRHASIIEEDSRWFIQDLDSGNGIVVGNRKVKKFELQDQLSFRIGKVEFLAHGFGNSEPAQAKTSLTTAPELVVSRTSNVEVGPEGSQGLATMVFVGILALVFYSGYGFFKDLATNPDLAVSEGDRLAGEGFFELRQPGPIQDSSWQIVTGDGTVQIVQGEGAPQGKKWMVCQGDPGENGVFRVQFQNLFDVKAGQGIRVSGRVGNEGFDRVGISVRWFERGDSGDVVVAENFTALRTSRDWSGVGADFPAPVKGAGGSARISIVGLGDRTGTLRCDQIIVRTIESVANRPATITAGENGQRISILVDERGVVQLSRGKTDLILDLRVALGSPRPMPWGQLLPSRKEKIVVGEDGSVRLGFEIHESGENAVIQQFARSIGWRIATTWSPQRPIPMMLVGKIPSRRVDEPVQVFSGDTAGVYLEKISDLQSCRGTEISLGQGSSQIVISFHVPVEFSVRPEAGGRGLLLIADAGLVAVGGSVDVSISASSEREQARVQTAYQQVVDALEERQEGRAVRLIADARESFVWRDDLHKKLDLLELQLQVEVQAALDQIDAVQADLERYAGSPAGQYLEQICQMALSRFEGLEPATLAISIIENRQNSAQSERDLRSVGRIDQVLIHAREALGKDHNEIARFYFQWVIDHHSESDGAQEAQQGLKILEARGG